MLKQRVITAVVLLLVLLPALFFHDPAPFSFLALLFMAAAAWEWARLNGYRLPASYLVGAVCGLICAGLWWAGWLTSTQPRLWLLTGAAWVLLGSWVLRAGVPAWGQLHRGFRLGLGLLALVLTWLAVAQARQIGTNFLLSVFALVWVADIGAYFAGRTWGGRLVSRKLAASISPGKSWEGVWGGMVAVLLLAWTWTRFDLWAQPAVPSFYSHLAERGVPFVVIACLFMAAMSVVGDLFESLVKRSAGVKDSSSLLPGHGGVLDRVDALLPSLPLAMMLYTF
ncbi:phosphatidate cytidylyltransferase [Rhodoferax sp.]|uniref:phosphatidate cytidylyltransferase n=1 Tax=Rhodoferax sp. TaxID=50421 RepID=UPI002628CD76|nr:phosphatidate cytidylyltransferase [Rhodoferax sp.]MDD3937766.1 phosphatidate cytidylyltransferase [Rhodoferax sp.]